MLFRPLYDTGPSYDNDIRKFWELRSQKEEFASHLAHLTDDLVVLAHVRRPEVDQDVDDEHDVHCRGEGKEEMKIRLVSFKSLFSSKGKGRQI